MFTREQYELIDFGDGRKLERMGELVLDRPCPTVNGIRPAYSDLWRSADVYFFERRFTGKKGTSSAALGVRGMWRPLSAAGARFFAPREVDSLSQKLQPEESISRSWMLPFSEKFVFELKGSPFGHVGVFPEQAENWDLIEELCREGENRLGSPLRVLNLFGYTGGSALAAAFAHADVTHLDAAGNVVAQAKRNASLSFGTDRVDGDSCGDNCEKKHGAIRWITDDAVKFVKREERRKAGYHGIILDPPSYGHGARGEVWRLSRDLEPLLERCVNLLNSDFNFTLLTGHTPNFGYQKLGQMLRQAYSRRFGSGTQARFLAKPLGIRSRNGAILPAGDMALAVFRK